MSEIAHVTTHADDAVARLLAQFQGRPRLEAFIRALARQFQDIEDAAWDVLVQSALAAAVGAELDIIGKLVGQARAGSPDVDYRVFLSARIKTNRSSGKPWQLVEIAKLILGSANPVVLREYYPSAITMSVEDAQANTLILWRDFLERAKGAAKSLELIYTKQPAATSLKLGSSYGGLTLTTTQRPGSSWTTGTGGGALAGAFG